ncbi:unnamed protein product [Dovyalis caffra]|uniref:Uncharacterized protein n=1 Tax=Dovyalis caffra TaxID=77055 RepID=A0AAV1RT14_9ROSI|nr:unnamed protein product [Dovyalis caffra]
MAEAFATDIAKSLLRKLVSFAVQEFCLAWGLEGDLARLEERLSAINAVLSDAERQQSQNDRIRLWLQKLKEVFEQTIDHSNVLHEETERRQSFESFSGLIGRDKDKEHIISLLVEPFEVDGAHPFVVPIVGMGGLGKTALAKTVCDESAHFELKMMACVSDGFTLKQVISKIIKSATGEKCTDLDESELKAKLDEILNGALGSKIVVTTRSQRVAEIMGTVAAYDLSLLDQEDCLLPKSTFKLQNLQALFPGDGLEELPKDVRYMISLRMLFLVTKQQRLPEGGIGCLECLQFLCIASCENLEYLCEDLQGLKSLRKLCIVKCRSLISLPRSMKYLTALEFLTIAYCGKLDLMTMEEEYEEEIKPLRLQTVKFVDLPATLALPEQMLQGSADSLRTLVILGCPNIKELPECVGNLNKLQELVIWDCPSLSRRCQRRTGEDWPKIARIPQINVQDIDSDEETSD